MGVIHVKTITVTPADDQYAWSVVDDATNASANWVTVTQDGSGDNWNFDVEVNTGSARSAVATVSHSDGVTTDTFNITQAGGVVASPASYDSVSTSSGNPSDEGSSITFIVSTSNVAAGTIPTYELTQFAGSFNANDIVGGLLTGNMSAINTAGQSSVTIQLAEDNTLEGTESYTFRVTGDDAGTPSSQFPVVSGTRQINYTSAPAPVWNTLEVQSLAGTTITNNYTGGNEGNTLSAVLTGANRPAGETLYWRLDYSSASYEDEAGQTAASSSDFNADSGSFQTGQTNSTYNQSGSDDIGFFSYEAVLDYIDEGHSVFGVGPSGLSGTEGYGIRIYEDAGMTVEILGANGNPLRISNFALQDVTTAPPLTTQAEFIGSPEGVSPPATTSTSSTTTSPTYGCHVAGTMIEMVDGTFKAIENLVTGDQVTTAKIDGLSIIESAWVTWTTPLNSFNMSETAGHVSKVHVNVMNGWISVNLGQIKVTHEHPLLSDQSGMVAYRQIRDLKVGDKIYVKSGAGSYAWVDITSYELEYANGEKTPVNVYSIDVENQDSYFANGVLAHNIQTGNSPATTISKGFV